MEDILKIHSEVCPKFVKNVQISVDGISEAKSSSVSLDVYSTKFRHCRHVYPHRIVRPLKKGYLDNHEQLRKFIRNIADNEVKIDCAVADNPKRSNMKGCQCHSAFYPCEYCFAKGVRCCIKRPKCADNHDEKTIKLIKDKLKKIENVSSPESKKTSTILQELLTDMEKGASDRKKMTVWPCSTANKELRTKDNILEIVCCIEAQEQEDDDNDPLTKDELKGVLFQSVLFELDYFDFVNDVPSEYMHLGCLGVVKRLTELTFNVGINRSRITQRKLSSTKTFNFLMSQTKVVFEFSRRSRDLDFAVFKAEEFRNLVLFFFPHVLSCIENDAKEKQLWLYLAFIICSCTLPDCEYFNINVNQITMCCEKFYKLFKKLFGAFNCSYSIHVLCCHVLQMRQLGPLTETSAFKFESFYGELRNAYQPGTPSTLKQMFENVILKRSLCAHSCEKPIYLSNYDTALECNSLIYTYINDEINMYKVLDQKNDEIICNPQGKFLCNFKETPALSELAWSSVGVFRKGPASNELVKVPHASVSGKVLKVADYLITCPENVLKEK